MKCLPKLIVLRIHFAILIVSSASAFIEPILLVHGGAGDILENVIPKKLNGIKEAIRRGYRMLIEHENSLDAVEEAIRYMEDDVYFNTGYGSVLNSNGEVEMDAAIANGYNLTAGCVAVVKDIAHPITLARRLMEKSSNVFLAGEEGTRNFAIEQNIEILPPGALITNNSREVFERYTHRLQLRKELSRNNNKSNSVSATSDYRDNGGNGEYERGTVGAVAIDRHGNIAAATSTGGIMGKRPGRVGDSPILGSGTFADNLIAGISVTGDGEFILRFNLARQIAQRIEYGNMTAQQATTEALNEMKRRVGGLAGAITIDRMANVGIFFVSKQMAWGYRQGNILRYGANKGQIIEEQEKEVGESR